MMTTNTLMNRAAALFLLVAVYAIAYDNAKQQAAAVRREVRADMPDMLRACRPWPLLQGRTPADEALLHFVRATVLHGSAVAVRHAASHTTSRSRQILPVARTGCLNRGSAAYR